MDIESIKKLWFVGGQITGDDIELLIEKVERYEKALEEIAGIWGEAGDIAEKALE